MTFFLFWKTIIFQKNMLFQLICNGFFIIQNKLIHKNLKFSSAKIDRYNPHKQKLFGIHGIKSGF